MGRTVSGVAVKRDLLVGCDIQGLEGFAQLIRGLHTAAIVFVQVFPIAMFGPGYGAAVARPSVRPHEFLAAAIVDNNAVRIAYGGKNAAIGRHRFRYGVKCELDGLRLVAFALNRQACRRPGGHSAVQYMHAEARQVRI